MSDKPRQPVRSLEDVVAPRRPAGVPYDQGEDVDAQALLEANGYGVSVAELVDTLDSPIAMFQAAAARLLGARQERAAREPLDRITRDRFADETVRVQAAYALARMGDDAARDRLAELLALPLEATPAPLQAAGALARLGDPRGFAVALAGLESPNRVIAMIAAKQLYAFAPLDGAELPDGGRVAAYQAFRRALRRPEPNIVGETRAQLDYLETPEARALRDEGVA